MILTKFYDFSAILSFFWVSWKKSRHGKACHLHAGQTICSSHNDKYGFLFPLQWRIQDFPKGGRGPRRGAVDPRGGYVSKILHVKTKESGPVGGAARPPLDPPMPYPILYAHLSTAMQQAPSRIVLLIISNRIHMLPETFHHSVQHTVYETRK